MADILAEGGQLGKAAAKGPPPPLRATPGG